VNVVREFRKSKDMLKVTLVSHICTIEITLCPFSNHAIIYDISAHPRDWSVPSASEIPPGLRILSTEGDVSLQVDAYEHSLDCTKGKHFANDYRQENMFIGTQKFEVHAARRAVFRIYLVQFGFCFTSIQCCIGRRYPEMAVGT
jgi:hypothetical protein